MLYDDVFGYYEDVSRIVGEAPAELPCKRCGDTKPVDLFPVVMARGKPAYWSYCADCRNGYARDRRARDPNAREKANAYYLANAERKRQLARETRSRNGANRKGHLRKLYGMSVAEYQGRLDAQGGVCAICGRPPHGARKYLAVDHDHETGEIRGLLCTTCNVGLGSLQDSKELLRAALAYLERR